MGGDGQSRSRRAWQWLRNNPVQSAVALLVLAGAGATAAISASPMASYSGCGYGYSGTGYGSYAVGYGTCPSSGGSGASTPPSATPPAAPTGAATSASGSSSSQNGTASATNDGTTVTATGIGGITVAQFGADPQGPPDFATDGQWLDVRVSTGNTFSSVTVQDCTAGGGDALAWWNPAAPAAGTTTGAWQPVTPVTATTGPPACLTADLSATSTPSVSELTGTVFAVGTAPAVTAVSPANGPTAGGTKVTVTGVGFSTGATVTFGTTRATDVTEMSSNQLVATSPASAAGPVAVRVTTAVGTSPITGSDTFGYLATPAPPPALATHGYWLAGADGGIFGFGGAGFDGSAGGLHLDSPIVAVTSTPSGAGYWMVARDGGIFSFGDAGFYGSLPGLPAADQPGAPVVGMAATADGKGYWEVTSKGDVYSFGDATFHGSTGNITLNQPIVGMAATPNGGGYWLVAKDGGLFAFGNAPYDGSLPGLPAAEQPGTPVVAVAAAPSGAGYWEVTSAGDVYSFGFAAFHGSTGNITLNQPIVGMAATPNGGGYWLVAKDGGLFAFGNAPYDGSLGGITLNQPVIGMATAR